MMFYKTPNMFIAKGRGQIAKSTSWDRCLTEHYGKEVKNYQLGHQIEQGDLVVILVPRGDRVDFFNFHPKRTKLQLIYSLPKVDNYRAQLEESMAALKRCYS